MVHAVREIGASPTLCGLGVPVIRYQHVLIPPMTEDELCGNCRRTRAYRRLCEQEAAGLDKMLGEMLGDEVRA